MADLLQHLSAYTKSGSLGRLRGKKWTNRINNPLRPGAEGYNAEVYEHGSIIDHVSGEYHDIAAVKRFLGVDMGRPASTGQRNAPDRDDPSLGFDWAWQAERFEQAKQLCESLAARQLFDMGLGDDEYDSFFTELSATLYADWRDGRLDLRIPETRPKRNVGKYGHVLDWYGADPDALASWDWDGLWRKVGLYEDPPAIIDMRRRYPARPVTQAHMKLARDYDWMTPYDLVTVAPFARFEGAQNVIYDPPKSRFPVLAGKEKPFNTTLSKWGNWIVTAFARVCRERHREAFWLVQALYRKGIEAAQSLSAQDIILATGISKRRVYAALMHPIFESKTVMARGRRHLS